MLGINTKGAYEAALLGFPFQLGMSGWLPNSGVSKRLGLTATCEDGLPCIAGIPRPKTLYKSDTSSLLGCGARAELDFKENNRGLIVPKRIQRLLKISVSSSSYSKS